MAGHLRTNPYLKTYDELQRSVKRMESYITTSGHLLGEWEIAEIKQMVNHMQSALAYIPEEFRKTKHHYSKKD